MKIQSFLWVPALSLPEMNPQFNLWSNLLLKNKNKKLSNYFDMNLGK